MPIPLMVRTDPVDLDARVKDAKTKPVNAVIQRRLALSPTARCKRRDLQAGGITYQIIDVDVYRAALGHDAPQSRCRRAKINKAREPRE